MTSALDNYSPADLADEFGSLNEMAKDLDKRMKQLREEILARKLTVIPGHEYTITVARLSRATIDKDRVVGEMGQEWWDLRTKASAYDQVTSRKQVKEEAA
jgi:hypothetical protein